MSVFVGTSKRLLTGAGKDLGGFLSNMWRSARGILNSYGETAKGLVGMMEGADHAAGLRAGRDLTRVEELVKGLGRNEREHVFDALDGRIIPEEEKYAKIAGEIRKIYDSYADDASDLGLDMYGGNEYRKALNAALKEGLDYQAATRRAMEAARVPFQARENYMPHYYGEAAIEAYLKPGKQRDALLDQLINRGWAEDRKSAEVVMREMLERPAEFRGGALQHTREDLFGVGYDRDLLKVSQRYFTASARRLEQARAFGARDEQAYKIINAMGDEGLPDVGEKQEYAASIYTAWAGTKDPRLNNLARVLSPIHSVTLLSTAGIVQPSQMMNTVARVGWVNTIKAGAVIMKDWVNQEGGWKQWARSTGATIDSVRADFQLTSLSDFSSVWMKLIGMEKLDRVNRVVSAVAGRFYAENLAKRMMKGGVDAGQMRRLFGRLGIDAEDLYRRGGKLTDDELRGAGLHVSRDTQFASSVLDLPPLRNTPEGRFMYLFKSFSLQQTYFLNRELKDELIKHKNPWPAIQYLTALGVAAPVMGEAIRQIKGRGLKEWEKEDQMKRVWATVENAATVGAGAAFWDATRAMGSGQEAIFRYIMGPSVGEAVQIVGADLPPIVKRGDFMPLWKHIVRRTPMIGSALYNLWWPPE